MRDLFNGIFFEFILLPFESQIQQSIQQTEDESIIQQFCNLFKYFDGYSLDYLVFIPIKNKYLHVFEECSSFTEFCIQYQQIKKKWITFFSQQYLNIFIDWIDILFPQLLLHLTVNEISWQVMDIPTIIHFLSLFIQSQKEENKKNEILSFIQHSCQSYLSTLLQEQDIQQYEDQTVYEKGKIVCEILQGFQQISFFPIDSLLTIPHLVLYIHLTFHHAMICQEKQWFSLAAQLLHLFKHIDFTYYQLFLIRWNSHSIQHTLELTFAKELCSTPFFANIQTILSSGAFVNESLITPYIGNYNYILPLESLSSYPLLKKYIKQDENKSFSIQTQLGRCCLEVNNHTIYCCPAQLLILLLFQHSNQVSINEIISRSPFQPSITRHILQSLTCCDRGLFYVSIQSISSDITLPSLLEVELVEEKKEEVKQYLFDISER